MLPLPEDYGDDVAFRPPKSVFGIAWFLLLFLLGTAWARRGVALGAGTGAFDAAFLVLVILLVLYIASVHRDRRSVVSVWVTYAAFCAALLCFGLGDATTRVLVVPLVAWCIFAAQLQQAEICGNCKSELPTIVLNPAP